MPKVFHITHLQNLHSIVTEGGLVCDRESARVNAVGIAHAHIKERRAQRVVRAGPGGNLCDYVPFYFAPRSPMLYAIHGGFVEGYQGGQAGVIHLVSSVERVRDAGLRFVFTDGHADMEISGFFENLGDLGKIDWSIMSETYWHDTDEDGDRKRRRQAEFLVHQFFPLTLMTEIGVINQAMGRRVEQALGSAGHLPAVTVRRDWYY